MDALGIDQVVRKMEAQREKHGARFAPAQILVDMAKQGKKFFER
jgi:hypothetical protein